MHGSDLLYNPSVARFESSFILARASPLVVHIISNPDPRYLANFQFNQALKVNRKRGTDDVLA